MKQDPIQKLVRGYRNFYERYTSDEYAANRKANASGQSPKVMVISCSDSRSNPILLTNAKLGEIFHVANVANVVPPYKPERNSHHSTSAAIEFAVNALQVEHIIVLGHSNCGGIRALVNGLPPELMGDEYSFIVPWVSILKDAAASVAHLPKAEQCACCEQEGVKLSLKNLETFPWIAQRIQDGSLKIHGWYFEVGTGILHEFDENENNFVKI